jgi:carbamoyl-phosphate synthase small subunit
MCIRDSTHTNLNDETVEGLTVHGKKAFSVQYHPEAAPGPHDSRYLFDHFISLMEGNRFASHLKRLHLNFE